jgi:hypothetical protein
LAVSQLKLRSITAGSELNGDNLEQLGVRISIVDGDLGTTVKIERGHADEPHRRSVEIHLWDLVSLARIESDSPARAPVSETPLPLAPGGRSFGGKTFDPEKDEVRLSRVLSHVRDIMAPGVWLTIDQIDQALLDRNEQASHAGISARIRDLRKPQFGGHTVERERHPTSPGRWRYRLVLRALS